MKKKFLVCAMLLWAIIASANPVKIEGIYYNLDTENKTAEVTYDPDAPHVFGSVILGTYSGSVVIPEKFSDGGTEYSVTSVGHYAFCSCSGLVSVTIPNSVISISDAFYSSSNLKSVVIGSGLASISSTAFQGCENLADVYCYATNVPMVTGSYYFPSQATLHVPASSLEAYKADATWSQFGNIVAIPSAEKVEIGGLYYNLYDGLNTAEVIRHPNWLSNNYTGDIVIPESVLYGNVNYHVTSVADDAFNNCDNITSVSIGSNVTTIGENGFYSCNGLTSVSIPNSVKYIGEDAFRNCALSTINFPEEIEIIEEKAFHDNPWYDNQPEGLIYINKVAYSYKGDLPQNSNIIIKDGTISISGLAFQDTENLKTVVIPGSVIYIGERAFDKLTYQGGTKECGLTDVYCYATDAPELGMTLPNDYGLWPRTAFPLQHIYQNTTLHVPSASVEKYKETIWMYFKDIVALTDDDPKPATGINSLTNSESSTVHKSYTIDGKLTEKPQRGLNIIRLTDGSTKKVVLQ